MQLIRAFAELIAELDRVHPDGGVDAKAWSLNDDNSLPSFVVAENGLERFFTRAASTALKDFAEIRYENDAGLSSKITLPRFMEIVRNSVANLHAADSLKGLPLTDALRAVNDAVDARVDQLRTRFTHYLSCWTANLERKQPYTLGPVTIMSREHWVASVDFPPEFLKAYRNTPEENAGWKQSLLELIQNRAGPREAGVSSNLAKIVYSAIDDCPAILKVEIAGYDIELSKRVAEIVCKSALDCLSLSLARRDYYFQLALQSERLPPVSTSTILESDGQLWIPGSTMGPRARSGQDEGVRDYLNENRESIAAFDKILNALVDRSGATHPNLCQRWATALDWFAEGQRERNDAVAVAKMGTSLDVLSCGGKSGGILEMLESLFGIPGSQVVVTGRKPKTLSEVVHTIYSRGRSQILHGTEYDRLKSFAIVRNHAAVVGRLALLIAADRLNHYAGADLPLAFRTMPKPSR